MDDTQEPEDRERPRVAKTVFDYLADEVKIGAGPSATVQTVRDRLAELVLRNQGVDPRVWPGVGIETRPDSPTGFVGLTPNESMELQRMLGTIDGLTAAAGEVEAEIEAAMRIIGAAMDEIRVKMKETATRAILTASRGILGPDGKLRARGRE